MYTKILLKDGRYRLYTKRFFFDLWCFESSADRTPEGLERITNTAIDYSKEKPIAVYKNGKKIK